MASILVVEDERSVRQALYFELLDEGYTVHCASSVQEAISALKAFRYDLIISDIFMDDGQATQLMELTRQLNKNIPFIIITAFPDSDLAVQVKAILKDRFFAKPFYAAALTAKAGEILRTKSNPADSWAERTVCP
jgi:DNA-binding response OmpR family regulator